MGRSCAVDLGGIRRRKWLLRTFAKVGSMANVQIVGLVVFCLIALLFGGMCTRGFSSRARALRFPARVPTCPFPCPSTADGVPNTRPNPRIPVLA